MVIRRAARAAWKATDFIGRERLVRGGMTVGAIGAGAALAGVATGVGAMLLARSAWNAMTMSSLNGKVALVTGASRGLGFVIAQELARQGCKLVICARNANELDEAATALRDMGAAQVLAIPCDVGKQEEVEAMVQRATVEMDRIDILVNNAGIIQVGPIESQTVDDFREAMDVMYWGIVYPTLAVLPQMKHRREGWIANVTSFGGKVAVPHLVPYCSSKFAAVGFSEGMCAELAKDGIRVTTVVPGLMRTGSHINAYFKGDHRKEYSMFSLGATSPMVSIGARRAARSIVNAIRRGQAELILSVPAKVAVAFHGLFPGTTTNIMGITNRVLPGTGATSKERHRGKESRTAISESPLTALGRRPAREFNQHPEEAAS